LLRTDQVVQEVWIFRVFLENHPKGPFLRLFAVT